LSFWKSLEPLFWYGDKIPVVIVLLWQSY
jgi:hypothetical protein